VTWAVLGIARIYVGNVDFGGRLEVRVKSSSRLLNVKKGEMSYLRRECRVGSLRAIGDKRRYKALLQVLAMGKAFCDTAKWNLPGLVELRGFFDGSGWNPRLRMTSERWEWNVECPPNLKWREGRSFVPGGASGHA
jgi:hypothetical protein